jgi:nicotinate-nucleotide adenylyltransferase
VNEARRNSIAVFGGTFDPVHIAHLRTAEEVLERLDIGDFRFVPAGNPPLRGNAVARANHRLAMLRLALSGHPRFSIDERELRREGPSYTLDTLREIRLESPAAPLLLVIGQDAACSLDRWHRWRELYDLAHIVIMRRPGRRCVYRGALAREMDHRTVDTAEPLFGRSHGLVFGVDVIQLPVSASAIREMIRSGRSPRYLVPAAVLSYIRENSLYGEAVA